MLRLARCESGFSLGSPCVQCTSPRRPPAVASGRSDGPPRMFLDPIDGEGRACQRLRRQRQQHERIIVRRDAVAAELSAILASMDQRPLAAVANPDGDRLHDGAARRRTVTGNFVQVYAVEALRAMVAMCRTRAIFWRDKAAPLAAKFRCASVPVFHSESFLCANSARARHAKARRIARTGTPHLGGIA